MEAGSATGPAWAALVAGAFGAVAFGVLTDVSEALPAATRLLQWYRPAGALSGVAMGAVAVWLVAWALLHAKWRRRPARRPAALLVGVVALAAIAFVMTFPPFYELLVRH